MKKTVTSTYTWLFKILLALSALIALESCDDIIEEDLSNDTLRVLTPPPDFESNTSSISFFWEAIQGAEVYRLQVAQPDFMNPIEIRLDSAYSGNTVNIELGSGFYEWRMRAENFNSRTPSVSGRSRIDSTAALTGTTPVLVEPLNNLFSNRDSLEFQWEALNNANEYRFEMFNTTENELVDLSINQELSVWKTIPNEGVFTWSVQGINSFSVSNPAQRTFSIDRTPPPSVALTQPIEQAEVNQGVITFKWQIPEDNGIVQSDRSYSFEMSNDQSFGSFQFGTPLIVASDSVNISLSGGDFFWRVQAIDAAGNDSIFSSVRELTVLE